MHDYINTEHIDAKQEKYWLDNFKWALRGELKKSIGAWIDNKQSFFVKAFAEHYLFNYKSYFHFIEDISNKMIIGAENGADDAFEKLYGFISTGHDISNISLVNECTDIFSSKVLEKVINEMRKDLYNENELECLYFSYYSENFTDFNMFIGVLTDIILTGIIYETEKVTKDIYRALCAKSELPRVKRKIKLLKSN